jgi:hypothetical protein
VPACAPPSPTVALGILSRVSPPIKNPLPTCTWEMTSADSDRKWKERRACCGAAAPLKPPPAAASTTPVTTHAMRWPSQLVPLKAAWAEPCTGAAGWG